VLGDVDRAAQGQKAGAGLNATHKHPLPWRVWEHGGLVQGEKSTYGIKDARGDIVVIDMPCARDRMARIVEAVNARGEQ
jgi:hypothetical protein